MREIACASSCARTSSSSGSSTSHRAAARGMCPKQKWWCEIPAIMPSRLKREELLRRCPERPRALAFLPLRPDSELPRRFLPLVGGSNALVHCCRTCTTRRLSARVAEGYAHSCATMVCCSSASRRSRRSAREGGEGLRFASAAARFIPQQQGDACAGEAGQISLLDAPFLRHRQSSVLRLARERHF